MPTQKKKIELEIPVAAKRYADELLEEINNDRESPGKKPFDDTRKTNGKKKDNTSKKKLKNRKKAEKTRKIVQSTTVPESGLFVKGEHKRQFAYEAHTACDKNGFVLEAVITPGNVHDSVAFDDVYDKLAENYPEIETTVADSAYKTPHICKNCPTRHLCTEAKACVKTISKHIWSEYIELAEDIRHTPKYADLYKLRKEKIDRVFADAKEKHAMR